MCLSVRDRGSGRVRRSYLGAGGQRIANRYACGCTRVVALREGVVLREDTQDSSTGRAERQGVRGPAQRQAWGLFGQFLGHVGTYQGTTALPQMCPAMQPGAPLSRPPRVTSGSISLFPSLPHFPFPSYPPSGGVNAPCPHAVVSCRLHLAPLRLPPVRVGRQAAGLRVRVGPTEGAPPLRTASGGESTAGLAAGVVPPPQGVAWPGKTAGGGGGGGGWGSCVGVEQLLLPSLDPHSLIPVCTDGTLRVLTLQAPAAPRMVMQPMGLTGLAGAVLERGEGGGLVVCASDEDEVRWIDLTGVQGAARRRRWWGSRRGGGRGTGGVGGHGSRLPGAHQRTECVRWRGTGWRRCWQG